MSTEGDEGMTTCPHCGADLGIVGLSCERDAVLVQAYYPNTQTYERQDIIREGDPYAWQCGGCNERIPDYVPAVKS